MAWRNALVKAMYYYFIVCLIAGLFMFISTFNNMVNSFHDFDENDRAASIFFGGFLAYLFAGLFAIIVFKRKQLSMSNARFVCWAVAFFMLFMMPSLYVFLGIIFSSRGI